MRHAFVAVSIAIALASAPSQLRAADRLDELERALEAQKKTMELLQQEISALKQERARQQALEKEVEGLKRAQQQNQELTREVEQLKATAKPKFEAGFEKWQPYIRSTDGSFRLSPVGRIQVDFRGYEDGAKQLDGTPLTNTFLARRARIGLAGTFYRYFDFFVEADFGQGQAVLTDGYLDIHYWPEFRLRAGQFKVPFSYEELFSDNNIDFVERSVADNLTPTRDLGAMLHGSLFGGAVSYAGGIFNGSGQNRADTNNSKDLAGRLVILPLKWAGLSELGTLHLGADLTWGEETPTNDTAGQSLRGRTDGQFIFFQPIPTSGDRLRYSGEVAYYIGPFTIYGEYIQSQEERKAGPGIGPTDRPDLVGRGWYVTTTYVLTGETKVPGQTVIPNRWATPVGPERGWGAWELAARFAQLDFRANDPTVKSNRVNALTLGANWYLTPNVKWLVNFVQNWFPNETLTPFSFGDPSNARTSEWEFLTRLQLWF